jgi:hypothetical protein
MSNTNIDTTEKIQVKGVTTDEEYKFKYAFKKTASLLRWRRKQSIVLMTRHTKQKIPIVLAKEFNIVQKQNIELRSILNDGQQDWHTHCLLGYVISVPTEVSNFSDLEDGSSYSVQLDNEENTTATLSKRCFHEDIYSVCRPIIRACSRQGLGITWRDQERIASELAKLEHFKQYSMKELKQMAVRIHCVAFMELPHPRRYFCDDF